MEHPQKIVDIDVIMDVRDTTSAMSMDVSVLKYEWLKVEKLEFSLKNSLKREKINFCLFEILQKSFLMENCHS